jgi:enhancer of mRNA-decapping protein 3
MASQFIGLNILLTLNDPNNTQLHGLVAEVNGPELTLDNGNLTLTAEVL